MKIHQVFSITDGIYKYLEMLNVPWKGAYNTSILDLDYISNSGLKTVAPLVDILATDNVLDIQSKLDIANLIFNHYKYKWEGLYKTMMLTYNPIENYNMIETSTEVRDTVYNSDTKGSVSNTINNTSNSSSESNTTSNNNDTNDVFGFNSTEAVNSDKSESANTSENTSTNEAESESIENSTSTSNNSSTNNDEFHHNLTRSGNIGVTTTQQMLESERKILNFDFFKIINADIDDYITIKLYI